MFLLRASTRGTLITILSALMLFQSISCKDGHDAYEENEENEGLTASEMMKLWGEMRAYPSGNIPQEKFQLGFQKLRQDEEKFKKRKLSSLGVNAAAMTETPWVPLAPKNFAGRILSLAFHPTNANVMWAGSASGGLWKTTNGGTGAANGINWVNIPTGFPVLGISAIAVNPANANELYLGTGEVYNSGGNGYEGQKDRIFRGSYGIGIIKTTDGGNTWTKSLDFSAANLKGVADIIINPLKSSTIFAATTDGVYRSFNSGGSWQLIHDIPMAMDICMKPGDTSTIFVGAGNFGSTGSGIYKSVNAGSTLPSFAKLTSGLPATYSGMIRLHISPNNVNKVYASIGKSPGSTTANGLYSSTNGGSSWIKASTTAYINSQGWYAHDVVASPTNSNTVFVAEMDMYRTTTGGGTLTKISDWSLWNFNNTTVGTTTEGTTTRYVHADIHRLYVSPFSATTVFAVSDGGVFKTTNSGTSFVSLNGGLQTAQIYANMAVSSSDPNFMICGLQDNATFIFQGVPGCARKIGGDGFSAAIDPTNDNICFGSLYYFTVYKSTNRGGSFATVNNNSSGAEKACFNAPLEMSTSNPNTMYGGTIYVKKSVNKGSTWTNANGGSPLSNSLAPLLKIAVSKQNESILYASTTPGGGARSRLFKSVNGAASFTEITGVLPDRYYTDIAVDPTNDSRLLVTLSGFGSGHVFFSEDAGTNWKDISAGLPDLPHNTVVFNPLNPQMLIVGNDLGVYYTNGFTDGNVPAEWLPYNTGLTDATMVMDLAVTSNNKLRLGTHGKGLWENAMPEVPVSLTAVESRTDLREGPQAATMVYPNPTKGSFNVTLENTVTNSASITVYDMSGRMVYRLKPSLQSGRNQIKVDITPLRSGQYEVVIINGKTRTVRKIVKQ